MFCEVHQQICFCNSLNSRPGLYNLNKLRITYMQLSLYFMSCLLLVFSFFIPGYTFASELDDLIKNKLPENIISKVDFYKKESAPDFKAIEAGLNNKNSQAVSKRSKKNTESLIPQNKTTEWVKQILLRHYKATDDDPKYIKQDITEMATYYTQFPDVVMLLALLEDEPWIFEYKQYASMTKAIGTIFSIDRVEIYIGTRGAVQHKKHRACAANPVCISSPADVLLHELIHASIMLTTDKFIENGGMNSMFYPLSHEHDVINIEAELYKRMTDIDNIKRPQRHNHEGKYVASSCVTCVY